MLKYFLSFILCNASFLISAQSFPIALEFQNGNANQAVIGKRFGDKIFFEDSASTNLNLNTGFYSCIQNGNILFDFMVLDSDVRMTYDFQNGSVEFGDKLNTEFFNNLKAVQDSPGFVQNLSILTKAVMKMFYPQITVSQNQFKTHESLLDSTLVKSLKYEMLFFNSPFLSQALDFVYGKCVSPNYDSAYFSCNKFLREIKDENMYRYVLNWMLYNYETSKVLGSENVFIELAENHLKPLLTPLDTNGYDVLGKAQSLGPNRIGSIARDFRFKNVSDGSIQNMYDIEGLFKILFFYDPDCHHCKEVYPKAQALHDSIIDRGVTFLAMSVNGGQLEVKEFMDALNPKNSKVLFGCETDDKDFIGKYYIPVTPGVYILDANNRVKARGISLVDLRGLMKTFVGAY
mgnify:FL=1